MSELRERFDAEAIYRRLRDAVAAAPRRPSAIVGIHSGGAWIAERLHRDLGGAEIGFLSSAFHRDDYGSRSGLPEAMRPTEIGFPVQGADILLVDDILFTGRTVRAALNELFDFGRPRSVELAVLLDRGGRELPIEARYCGLRHEIGPERRFDLQRDADGRFILTLE